MFTKESYNRLKQKWKGNNRKENVEERRLWSLLLVPKEPAYQIWLGSNFLFLKPLKAMS